ncbi:dioxygenase [Streptomyces sp. NPDC098781]|uniref:dioxygenase family protein n=1 Tax=Streptomyces sp. NPDC098781 TaxID=3366097 RepID=UPI00382E8573
MRQHGHDRRAGSMPGRRPDESPAPDAAALDPAEDNPEDTPRSRSRRTFIRTTSIGVGSAAVAAAGISGSTTASASARVRPLAAKAAGVPLALTPSCNGGETPEQMEGPLFKPESPQRTKVITPGITGVPLTLRGVVYDPDCDPLADTLLEFWQTDHNGDYDTSGFSLRGHQYTNARGEYRLDTIIPRDYWGRWGRRTPHIHVRAQAPGGPLFITQLYFPDDTRAYGRDFALLNARDQLLNRACVVALEARDDGGYDGTFDFVVKTAV